MPLSSAHITVCGQEESSSIFIRESRHVATGTFQWLQYQPQSDKREPSHPLPSLPSLLMPLKPGDRRYQRVKQATLTYNLRSLCPQTPPSKHALKLRGHQGQDFLSRGSRSSGSCTQPPMTSPAIPPAQGSLPASQIYSLLFQDFWALFVSSSNE